MGLGLTPDLGPGLNLNPNHNLDQSLGHRQNPQTNFANLERALKKALRRQCSPTYRTSPRAHIKLPATADLSSIQKTGAPGPAPEFREFGARVKEVVAALTLPLVQNRRMPRAAQGDKMPTVHPQRTSGDAKPFLGTEKARPWGGPSISRIRSA